MTVDPEELRVVMRQWITGVTIVTTHFQGIHHGMTVNSFTSVSLTPPCVMVSIERTTRTHELLRKSGIFGVTILGEHQQEVSDCFAGRHTEHEDRFKDLETFTLITGSCFIAGGLAYLDCRVTANFEVGTHTLFIGEVLAAKLDGHLNGEEPLSYYDRAYRRLQK